MACGQFGIGVEMPGTRVSWFLRSLRINRRLAWNEIAQVMFHEGEIVDIEVLEREAIRLRKRYQSAKEKLRKLALAEGVGDAG
jgi:hypothetical protein